MVLGGEYRVEAEVEVEVEEVVEENEQLVVGQSRLLNSFVVLQDDSSVAKALLCVCYLHQLQVQYYAGPRFGSG